MADITNPAVTNPTLHGPYAALANHPGYYSLYALYHDYPVSNVWFQEPEHAARLKERLRTIQPLLELVQPYRKSYALRLFTERESLSRFPPDKANEAWLQLRRMIEVIGAPAGWEEGGKEAGEGSEKEVPEAREGPPDKRAAAKKAETAETTETEISPDMEHPEKTKRVFPKAPFDYDMEV